MISFKHVTCRHVSTKTQTAADTVTVIMNIAVTSVTSEYGSSTKAVGEGASCNNGNFRPEGGLDIYKDKDQKRLCIFLGTGQRGLFNRCHIYNFQQYLGFID